MQGMVWGSPVQQGSMTAGVTKKGDAYMRPAAGGARLGKWKKAIAKECVGQDMVPGAVEVILRFWLQKPRATKYPDYPAGTPDLDKLVRAALDGLTLGGAYEDDARVVRLDVEERWQDRALQPAMGFEVRPMPQVGAVD